MRGIDLLISCCIYVLRCLASDPEDVINLLHQQEKVPETSPPRDITTPRHMLMTRSIQSCRFESLRRPVYGHTRVFLALISVVFLALIAVAWIGHDPGHNKHWSSDSFCSSPCWRDPVALVMISPGPKGLIVLHGTSVGSQT